MVTMTMRPTPAPRWDFMGRAISTMASSWALVRGISGAIAMVGVITALWAPVEEDMLETEEAAMLGDPALGVIMATLPHGERTVVAVTPAERGPMQHRVAAVEHGLTQHRMLVADVPVATVVDIITAIGS